MDEFALIDAIRARLPSGAESVRVGIGDDAAVLRADGRDPVLTVDVSVEGVHFRRSLLSLREAGRRAFMAAASDLAAMGADATAALSSLILPEAMPDAEVLELVDGIADGARELGIPVVGGNVSSGGELSITTTVVGALDGPPLLRSGARPGDGVFVTGTPGASALGLAALMAPASARPAEAEPFVAAWRRPTAALAMGRALRPFATACVDLSDGLLQDLGHVCEASGVGARIEAAALPFAPDFERVAAAIGATAVELALTGGEGYELLFTAPDAQVPAGVATRIGSVTTARDVVVVDARGEALSFPTRGYRHRASATPLDPPSW